MCIFGITGSRPYRAGSARCKGSAQDRLRTSKSVILEKRESVISEVKQTINQLAQTYAELITSTSDDDPSRLSQLRNELDANIEFARTVDQNVRNLGRGDLFEQNEYDEYVNDKENQYYARRGTTE